MVRPKSVAIKRERTCGKWNKRQVFHLRGALSRIESRNPPFLRLTRHILVLLPTQNIKHPIGEGVTANLRADSDLTGNRASRIVLAE